MIEFLTDFVTSHPLLTVYLVFMMLYSLYLKRAPFPETGGNVTDIQTLDQWSELVRSYDGYVICDFYATWCPPCRTAAPIYGQLSTEFPSIRFVKVNVDAAGDISAEQGIRAMPTFKLFKKGVSQEAVKGFDLTKIRDMLEKAAEASGDKEIKGE